MMEAMQIAARLRAEFTSAFYPRMAFSRVQISDHIGVCGTRMDERRLEW